MIDLMYPSSIQRYDPEKPASAQNPGGGMATKVASVANALSAFYMTQLISRWEDVSSPVVLIEPLTPRLSSQDLDLWIEDLKACSAHKILYCSEMEVMRWHPKAFKSVADHVDVVTANTDYQKSMIQTLSLGQVVPLRLCDPIDTALFRPSPDKEKIVFGAGRIARFKNSGFLIDVFQKLNKSGIHTAYYGDVGLWGNKKPDPKDVAIQDAIKETVSEYEGSMPRTDLSARFGEASVIIGKTTHDVYSSTHVEALASGCVSIGGGHPMYRERPGTTNLQTPSDFARAVANTLSSPDLEKKQKEAREYALRHCSYEAFIKQFQTILKGIV